MSNLSSGNSCDESTEELAHETNSNVLSCTRTSCNDGSRAIHQEQVLPNKKRKLPGNPDPTAEVIALSPKTLMATNRFICEVCNKGFQREQNLQLHRRGHNLPWKLKQKTSTEIKKRVYICPEPTCIHNNPARALGDLTGIKKHYSRKHGEKKWKCDKCSKKYAVQSDWKAHSKTCGTKEYKCDCGTIFSRRDSFVTHRAFCDALTEENNKVNQGIASNTGPGTASSTQVPELMSNILNSPEIRNSNMKMPQIPPRPLNMDRSIFGTSSPNMSATALLQQAAQMGSTVSSSMINSSIIVQKGYSSLFNGMQLPIQSDHDQTQTGNSSVHGFVGSILQNGTQQTFSELLNSSRGDNEKNSSMQNDGWCINGLFNEENQRLLNNEGCDNNLTNVNGKSGNESLTLDFLGIGGVRQRSFHEMQQQQQEMSFEQQKVSQHSNQGLRSMWDV